MQDALKIGSPGAATSAITVAASTTRTRWRDIDGAERTATWLVDDDIAGFSSEGPRRDGVPKPDVTAPGAMIVSDAFAGKRFAVLGLARSGMAVVEALLASGAAVTAWDSREEPRNALANRGIELADPVGIDLTGYAGVVVSPDPSGRPV